MSEKKKKGGRIFVFTNKETNDKFKQLKQLFEELSVDLSEIKIDSKPYLSSKMRAYSKTSEKPPLIFFNSKFFGGLEKFQEAKENDLENLKNEIENTKEEDPGHLYTIYKQQKDIYDILPSFCYFPPPLGKTIVCSMKIHNLTEDSTAFKVKATAPKRYSVKPKEGIIGPLESDIIEITLQKDTVEIPMDIDKFRIEGVRITKKDDVSNKSVSEVFTTYTKTISKQTIEAKYTTAPSDVKVTTFNDGMLLIESLAAPQSLMPESAGSPMVPVDPIIHDYFGKKDEEEKSPIEEKEEEKLVEEVKPKVEETEPIVEKVEEKPVEEVKPKVEEVKPIEESKKPVETIDKKQLDSLKSINKTLNEEISNLKKQVDLLREEKETAVFEVTKKKSIEVSNLQKTIENNEKLIFSYKQKVNELQEEERRLNDSYIQQLKDKDTNIENLSQEYEKHKSELEAEKMTFNVTIQELTNTTSDLTSKIQILTQKIQEIEHENTNKEAEIDERKEQIIELKEIISENESKIRELNDDLFNKQTELKSNSETIDSLKKQKSDLKEEINEFNSKIEKLNIDLTFKDEEISSLKTTNENLISNDTTDDQIAQNQKLIDSLKDEVKKLKLDRVDVEKINKSKEEMISNLNQEILELKEKNNNLETQHSTEHQQKDEFLKNEKSFKKQITEKDAQITHLKDTVISKEEEIEKLNETKKVLFDEHDLEIQKIKQEKKDLELEINQLKQDLKMIMIF
eukprot:gene3854-7014_t